MRQPRLKVPPAVGEADYHCISKTVNGAFLFKKTEMEFLHRQIWKVADFCGVQVITETVMSNHFHLVVRVPQERPVSDAELLRRYRVLYAKATSRQTAQLKVIELQLAGNGPDAVKWRKKQLRQMGDVSQYMKLLKQRVSTWYNKTHKRFGPLWAQRFKSMLVGPGALQKIAAYIDLNCVRAGLVQDPKDYPFCGYAVAVAGDFAARAGLRLVWGGLDWNETQAVYRQVLFGTGGQPREGAACIPPEKVKQVLDAGGKLPLADALRVRMKEFTNCAALGSKDFIEQLVASGGKSGRRIGTGPHPLPAIADWGDLATLRRTRRQTIG